MIANEESFMSIIESKLEQYTPKPIDTSKIELPDELNYLVEALAENAHDTWAKRRIDDGWRYGPKRDDERKEHPNIVSYDKLSEGEKEYDRNMAIETLKLVILSGYRIYQSFIIDPQTIDSFGCIETFQS